MPDLPPPVADLADELATIGQAAKAVMEEAHARVCERGQWVLNEKGLVAAAGLDSVHARCTRVPTVAPGLASWVAAVADALEGPRTAGATGEGGDH